MPVRPVIPVMPVMPVMPARPVRRHRRLATLAALIAGPVAAAAIAPAVAQATPQMQLEQCIGLDRLELARSIESELAASPAAANADDLVIATSCSDGVSATVRVTERATRRQAERALALGEVTGELRPRLVALVAVELAESLLAAPRTVAAAFLPDPAAVPASAPARRGLALAVAPSAADDAAMHDAPTAEATRDEAPPPGLSSVFSGRPARRPSLAFSLGTGTRVYFEKPEPMLQASLEMTLRSISLGVVGAAAEAYHTEPPPFLGAPSEQIRYTSYLLGFSVRPQLYCLQGRYAGLCVDLHAEGGFTRVYAANVDPLFTDDDLRGQYLMAGTGVEARMLLTRSLESVLRVEAAASDGDIIRFGDTVLTSFNGALLMIHFSLRWMPQAP